MTNRTIDDPIIADCLKQIAHITQKYRNDIDAIAPMRVSHLDLMARTISEQSEKIAELEREVAACGRTEPAFDPTRKETPLDYTLKLAHAKRRRAVDEACSWKPYGRLAL